MYKFADFHCDTLLNICLRDLEFNKLNDIGHLDLPRLRQTDFVFQCFAVFWDPKFGSEASLRQTLRLINLAREKILSLPDVTWIKSGKDLENLASGNLAGLLSIEGADFLGDDLFLIELVHHLGVRLMTLTWNGRNSIADGVKVGGNSGGLTNIGIQAVKRMQELDIIVDVSHLSEKGFWDVDNTSVKPYVASHSNAWELCHHPRNLKDEQIKAIAQAKGLIGMNLCRPFVASDRAEQTLTSVVRHMVYIADLVGTGVLCLGCDLDGIRELPEGMGDVRDLKTLPDHMAEAGFSQVEIESICSKNLLKFMIHNLE